MKKDKLEQKLRKLSHDMVEVGVLLDYYGGFSEVSRLSEKLIIAGGIVENFADNMAEEIADANMEKFSINLFESISDNLFESEKTTKKVSKSA